MEMGDKSGLDAVKAIVFYSSSVTENFTGDLNKAIKESKQAEVIFNKEN